MVRLTDRPTAWLIDVYGTLVDVDVVMRSSERPLVRAVAAAGTAAGRAVLVDDNESYCRGALDAGLDAIHLCRDGTPQPDRSLRRVVSLSEIGGAQ